jgi:hypothetical protein
MANNLVHCQRYPISGWALKILYVLLALLAIVQPVYAQKAAPKSSEKADNEFFDLIRDRNTLDSRCSEAFKNKRSDGLNQACDFVKYERDNAASDALAHDGAKLAHDCEATDLVDQKAPLRRACVSYMSAFSTALGKQLADDAEAYAIVCDSDGDGHINDQPYLISTICGKSANILVARIVLKLLEDPFKLDVDCNLIPEDKMTHALSNACSERAEQKFNAEIILFVNDQTAFEKACAIYGQKLGKRLRNFPNSGEKEMQCEIVYRLKKNLNIRTTAAAKGLKCFDDREDSLDPLKCVSMSRYAEAKAKERSVEIKSDTSIFDENSSLSVEAHRRAAALIAKAKTDRTFLDELPFLAQFIPE